MKKRSTILGALTVLVTVTLANSILLPTSMSFAVNTNYHAAKSVQTTKVIYGKFISSAGKPLQNVSVDVQIVNSSNKIVHVKALTSASGVYKVLVKAESTAKVVALVKYKNALKRIPLNFKKGKTVEVSGKLISSAVISFLPIMTY